MEAITDEGRTRPERHAQKSRPLRPYIYLASRQLQGLRGTRVTKEGNPTPRFGRPVYVI